MIIGINSILFSFYDLFIDMLKTARNKIVNPHNLTLLTDSSNNINNDLHSLADVFNNP